LKIKWEFYCIHNILLYVHTHVLVLFGCLYALLMTVELFADISLLCNGVPGGRYSFFRAASVEAIAQDSGTVVLGRNYLAVSFLHERGIVHG
jgi:hypothetical protein